MLLPALGVSALLPGVHTSLSDLHAAAAAIWTALASCAVALSCALIVRRALAYRRRCEQCEARGMAMGADLVSPRSVEPGTRVSIEMVADNDHRTVRGRMLAVTGRYVEIEADPQLLPARVGTPLQVMLTAASSAYRFHTAVIDHRVADGAAVLVVNRPPWLERVQRRRYFRVPCELPTVFAPMPAEEGERPAYRCTIYDLSAAGMCVGTPIAMEAGRWLRVRVPMMGQVEMPVEMRVIRHSGGREPGLPHTLHCEFAPLPEDMREALGRRCFEIELQGMRRRRGVWLEARPPGD